MRPPIIHDHWLCSRGGLKWQEGSTALKLHHVIVFCHWKYVKYQNLASRVWVTWSSGVMLLHRNFLQRAVTQIPDLRRPPPHGLFLSWILVKTAFNSVLKDDVMVGLPVIQLRTIMYVFVWLQTSPNGHDKILRNTITYYCILLFPVNNLHNFTKSFPNHEAE